MVASSGVLAVLLSVQDAWTIQHASVCEGYTPVLHLPFVDKLCAAHVKHLNFEVCMSGLTISVSYKILSFCDGSPVDFLWWDPCVLPY